MTWVKTCSKSYQNAGLKKPVFLWDNLGRKRVFIDLPTGAAVDIQYCYDKLEINKENDANIKWHNYETGRLNSDFAFEIIGITALRLNVIGKKPLLKESPIQFDIYQQNEVKET